MATVEAASQAGRTRAGSPPGRGHRLATYLYRRPKLVLLLLLGVPLLWLVAVYLGSLATLILQSFFWLDSFTGQVVRTLTLANYVELTSRANVDIFLRTILMAAVVTLTCAVLAYPLAYYMARYASSRMKGLLYLLVLLPLWSSYLVRVYAWRLILAPAGGASWVFFALHLGLLAVGGP